MDDFYTMNLNNVYFCHFRLQEILAILVWGICRASLKRISCKLKYMLEYKKGNFPSGMSWQGQIIKYVIIVFAKGLEAVWEMFILDLLLLLYSLKYTVVLLFQDAE